MVKVHCLLARMNVGGPAFHVAHLSRALASDFDVTLYTGETAASERDMSDFARRAGVTVKVIKGLSRELSPSRDLALMLSLYRTFRREAPDVVHTHTAKAGAVGRVAAALAGVPVRIHTFHGHVLGGRYFSEKRTRLFLEVERHLARITNRIVVLTDGQRDELASGLGVAPPDAFRVIPLGLDLARFRTLDYPAGRDRARAALGLPQDSFVVAALGRLVPIKRHDLLLRALAALKGATDVDWRLVVIGGGELEAELKGMASDLGVADIVSWLDWRNDVPDVLQACDVLAQPSDDEGTPGSVMEAVAMGVPVVATDVGGVAEVLDGVPASWLARRGSVEDLSRALRRAEASRTSVPRDVRDTFVERFSVGRLARRVGDLYRSELDRRGIQCGDRQPRM